MSSKAITAPTAHDIVMELHELIMSRCVGGTNLPKDLLQKIGRYAQAAKAKPARVRIKLTNGMDSVSFIVVRDGKVQYGSAGGIPLALSNMASQSEALRFSLEDAEGDPQKCFQLVKAAARNCYTVELMP